MRKLLVTLIIENIFCRKIRLETVNFIEKSDLSPQQLNKIALLEKHRDGLKNELAKKSYNHDIVQQGFDKEKRKVGC